MLSLLSNEMPSDTITCWLKLLPIGESYQL